MQNRRQNRAITIIKNTWHSAMLMLITMQVAHAQAASGDPISRLLDKGVDLLTNRWALSSATIAIAIIGYRMKYGMMDKKKAITSILGIVVVFGAALIRDELR